MWIQNGASSGLFKLPSKANFLQFGLTKCFKVHVRKYKEKFKCRPVFHDSWTSQEKENKTSGKVEFSESFSGKVLL